MKDFVIDKTIFVMESEPSPELTADIVEKAISEIKTDVV